jgi:hypothetical protein
VQENVSPTYADPNAGGSVRRGDRMKASFWVEGQASDAEAAGNTFGESVDEGGGVGRGCWIERDGRESLETSVALFLEPRKLRLPKDF